MAYRESWTPAARLRPATEGAGRFELAFVLVAESNEKVARAANVLLHELAPAAWIYYLPLPMLEKWIDESGPGQVAPGLVSWIEGTELFLFYDMPRERFDALLKRIREKVGMPLLKALTPPGDRHHLAALVSLLQRAKTDAESIHPYGPLLR